MKEKDAICMKECLYVITKTNIVIETAIMVDYEVDDIVKEPDHGIHFRKIKRMLSVLLRFKNRQHITNFPTKYSATSDQTHLEDIWTNSIQHCFFKR